MLKQIIKAITTTLKTHFDGIKVYSTDVQAGNEFPCFFIEINSIGTEKLTSKIDILTLSILISYVNEDNIINQKESLEISEKLRNILIKEPIEINEGISFQIYENSIDIEDNYISIEFDVEMQLIRDLEENLPFMEDLIIKE